MPVPAPHQPRNKKADGPPVLMPLAPRFGNGVRITTLAGAIVGAFFAAAALFASFALSGPYQAGYGAAVLALVAGLIVCTALGAHKWRVFDKKPETGTTAMTEMLEGS